MNNQPEVLVRWVNQDLMVQIAVGALLLLVGGGWVLTWLLTRRLRDDDEPDD